MMSHTGNLLKYAAASAIATASLYVLAEPDDGGPTGKAVLRFENASYDGGLVSGTLLVGAVGGMVFVPAWSTEPYNFSLEDVSECGTHRKVRWAIADPVGNLPKRPPVIVEPGYWYGKDVAYPLFRGTNGPKCIEFTIAFLLEAQRPAAELRLRISIGKGATVLPK
jgi:hypothetical protein